MHALLLHNLVIKYTCECSIFFIYIWTGVVVSSGFSLLFPLVEVIVNITEIKCPTKYHSLESVASGKRRYGELIWKVDIVGSDFLQWFNSCLVNAIRNKIILGSKSAQVFIHSGKYIYDMVGLFDSVLDGTAKGYEKI